MVDSRCLLVLNLLSTSLKDHHAFIASVLYKICLMHIVCIIMTKSLCILYVKNINERNMVIIVKSKQYFSLYFLLYLC